METGKAIPYAAGDDAGIERARPVLDALGEMQRIKDAESAAKLKLIANTMLAGVSALGAELLAAGRAARVEAEDVFWVLNRFAPGLASRRAGYVDHKYEPVTFALSDAAKDLRLATPVYREAGATTPMTDTAKELYDRAAKTAGARDKAAIRDVDEKQPGERKA